MAHKNWTVASMDGQPGEMSREDAAYLAGLIDGEGTISVYARPQTGSDVTHYVNEHVSVVNTNLELLRHVLVRVGAGVIYGRDRCLGNKVCYSLHWDSRRAVAVLEQIRPFLVGKREQADLTIASLALKSSRKDRNWVEYTDEDLARLSNIVNLCGKLNGGKRKDVQILRRQRAKTRPRPPYKICEVDGCESRACPPAWNYCKEHWSEVVDEVHQFTCEWCKSEFKSGRLDQRFCSTKCQWQAARFRREGKGATRTFECPACGIQVLTTDPRKTTCCERCYCRLKYEERKRSGYFEKRKKSP